MTLKERLKGMLTNYKRVLKKSKKPESDEYWKTSKITGIGIMVIGVIGFIIKLISYYI